MSKYLASETGCAREKMWWFSYYHHYFFFLFLFPFLPNRYYVCCARSFDVVCRCCWWNELTIYSGSSTNQLGDSLMIVSLATNALTNDSVFSAVIKFPFFSSVELSSVCVCFFLCLLSFSTNFVSCHIWYFQVFPNNERAFQNEQRLRTNGWAIKQTNQ